MATPVKQIRNHFRHQPGATNAVKYKGLSPHPQHSYIRHKIFIYTIWTMGYGPASALRNEILLREMPAAYASRMAGAKTSSGRTTSQRSQRTWSRYSAGLSLLRRTMIAATRAAMHAMPGGGV